jgi:hypothetical protein
MTIPALPFRRTAPVLFLTLAGLTVSWTAERGSVERGNRLHRGGAPAEAVTVYGDRVGSEAPDESLRYNLGTALLVVGVAAAGPELAASTESADVVLRERGLYNLGLWNLMQALETESTDSARAYTLASVDASKDALRLSPGRFDARWNLAMAQRMLDSIESSDGRAGTETVDGSASTEDLVRTEDARELQDESPVGDGPQQGEDETPAASDDYDPLTIVEADDILGSAHLDPSPMIRKLLAFEGREQRRTRFNRTTPRW